ncbi:MAG: IS21 family transposase [Acidimicrobiia bacterium]|nr:IS21 family transposase [Acidimicrobiia bacterium]
MTKRSKVQLYEQIRRVHEREQLSIRELSRRFGVHRRDVRAALESAVPAPRKISERPAPKMDEFKPIIDGWLEADRSLPRKQWHTARRVWQRLVDEHDADVGESTVRKYVKVVRERQETPLVDVAVPQHHPLGEEAEVDFGSIHVYLAGTLTEVAMFIMRLSASGRAFPAAYLNEAQEVFLDGHVRAFEHFGGIPVRVRYDNLKAAVVRVLRGRDRVESGRFVAMRSHYGFESFFCRPGIDGAHEKGGVEGEIGRFRRRHLVPIPRVASMAELNELMLAGALVDDRRHIAHRRITVGEHFDLEAGALRSLPTEAFDVAVVGSNRVDTKSRVCVRQVHYSVPVRYVRQRLDVRVGAETIEVLDGARVVARHGRGRKGDEVLVLDHYLEVLARKPGAMLSATPLARARASGAFTATHERFWAQARRRLGDANGTRAMVEVLLAHRTIATDAIVTGMNRALSADSVDAQVVIIEARRAAHNDTIAPVVPIGTHTGFDRPKPSLDSYDQLLENTP